MSETYLADAAWQAAHNANQAFDAMRAAEVQENLYHQAMLLVGVTVEEGAVAEAEQRVVEARRNFAILQDMAAPAMLIDDSPFLMPKASGETATTASADNLSAETFPFSILVKGVIELHSDGREQTDVADRIRDCIATFATDVVVSVQDHDAEAEVIELEQLDLPIMEVIKTLIDDGKMERPSLQNLGRIKTILQCEGVSTFRELLALGRGEVSDMPKMGAAKMSILASALQALLPTMSWKDRVTVDDIANLYKSVYDIPAFVFGCGYGRRTVGALLEMDAASLAAEKGLAIKQAEGMLAELRQFTRDFNAARAKLS